MDVTRLDDLAPSRPRVVALGFFDGVHLGHQRLVATTLACARARGASASLLTFRDHPLRLLRPEQAPPLLTTFEEKIEVLTSLGLDAVAWCDFTAAFSRRSPASFADEILRERMGAVAVVTGPNYRFGAGGEGDVARLVALGAQCGFDVEAVPPVEVDGVLVSSTRIRAQVAEGAMDAAARMLGRPYRVQATVVRGDGRGRTMGFPTANLEAPADKLLPKDGVYAVTVHAAGTWRAGVANIGVRPTFGQHRRVFEAHLLDTTLDLYGETVDVDFVGRIRSEMRFDGVDALIAQIGRDVEAAREMLAP